MTYGQKGYANKTSMKALKDTIKRRNLNATLVEGESPGFFRVEYSKR
jgi:hypothetical protein